jgi:hypothetical protein
MPVLRLILWCVILFALGACSLLQHEKDVDVVQVAQQLLTAQKDQYGDPLPVKLPVQINYTVSRKPQIDRDLHIDFQFIALKAIPVLRIGLTTSDGLDMISDDVRLRYLKLKPRQTFSRDVVVRPTAENEFYLNLYVVTENGDKKLAKLIRVPIAIGEYALKNLGTLTH